MATVYDNPRYYEIAFSFRDIPKEVSVFEECISRYSGIPVRSVLEVACGNSPHMAELVRRGYKYTGFDINQSMLDFSRMKAEAFGNRAVVMYGDMRRFSVPEHVDFAFVALGSWFFRSTQEILSHLRCMAESIRSGGLYFLDWCVQFAPFSETKDSWTIERDDVRVKTHFSSKTLNRAEQLIEEEIRLEVEDHGAVLDCKEVVTKRVIFPQEFLRTVELAEGLEFVGWWNNWDLSQPLSGVGSSSAISRPVTLLRRR